MRELERDMCETIHRMLSLDCEERTQATFGTYTRAKWIITKELNGYLLRADARKGLIGVEVQLHDSEIARVVRDIESGDYIICMNCQGFVTATTISRLNALCEYFLGTRPCCRKQGCFIVDDIEYGDDEWVMYTREGTYNES